MTDARSEFFSGGLSSVNILRPNGSVERMSDGHRRPTVLAGYGRDKDGSPKDVRSLKIARDNDRRGRDRQGDQPSRGNLIDLSA